MELFSLNPNISAKPLSNNQGWFRNPQDELILKMSLLVRFDQELAEILRVKEKASISKSSRFFRVRVYMSLGSVLLDCDLQHS